MIIGPLELSVVVGGGRVEDSVLATKPPVPEQMFELVEHAL